MAVDLPAIHQTSFNVSSNNDLTNRDAPIQIKTGELTRNILDGGKLKFDGFSAFIPKKGVLVAKDDTQNKIEEITGNETANDAINDLEVDNNAIVFELYKKLKEADEDIDTSYWPILEEMQKNDGVITIDELKEEFSEDLITPEFIKEMQSNPVLNKGIQYADISNDAINKLLEEINDNFEKAKQYKQEAGQYKQEAGQYKQEAGQYKQIGEQADINAARYKENAARYKENAARYKAAREKLGG